MEISERPEGYVIVTSLTDGPVSEKYDRIKLDLKTVFDSFEEMGWIDFEGWVSENDFGLRPYFIDIYEELFDMLIDTSIQKEQADRFLRHLYHSTTGVEVDGDIKFAIFPSIETGWGFDALFAFFYPRLEEEHEFSKDIVLQEDFKPEDVSIF